ncbi:uncharacterized protein F4807DRAFT_257107 [Annulohypoxylon truncatum]|uniref:uncharacterized protein n=1 Tax=Annulohypoxylon truncatum TaxID=327061 RepID=UPI002007A0F2|nr:uncharacterized protein F4807DRAFT_257107 [Annulohypoxylon truncatum]KAI1213274.1 hypothetical protein F4807DRAFT_257107 [Annulohypoxylon truncatum]
MSQYKSSKMDRPEPGLIKWSPNPNYNTFLHVNLQHRVVQLYEPTGHAQPGNFQFHKTSKYDEIPPLTTYDWSPAHRGLVAIGTASGTVDLINLHSDSSAHLELPIRITRTCQAVAFNTGTLLAVGLERVRNDQCLKIFDVNKLTALESGATWESLEGSMNPVIGLEASISISSTKFFEDSPQVLVAGIKNQGIRIYDLRDPQGAVINYATKCNNNLAIDYADQNYFASTSLDKPGLVIWDRRATSRSSSSRFYLDAVDTDELPWGAALNIDRAIDVKDANFQDRGSLTRSVRFCRDRSGLIAVLSRTGQLKVLDIKKEFIPSDVHPKDSPEVLEVRRSYELDMSYVRDRKDERIVSFDWLNLDSPALTPRAIVLRANGTFDILEKPSYTSEHLFKMIPWKAPHRGLEGGYSYHSLMSFEPAQYSDMISSLNIDRAFEDMPLFGVDKGSPHAIVQEALLSPAPTDDPIYDSEASDIELAESFANAFKIADKLRILRKYSKENLETSKKPDDKLNGLPSNRELHERLLSSTLDTKGFPKKAQVILDHLMLLRSKEKYLFDYVANRDIVADDPWLRELWGWISRADEAAYDMGMVSQGIDLSYMGVCNIWNGDLGLNGSARLLDGTRPPDLAAWERCLQEINRRSRQPIYDGVETKKLPQRLAALRICGWGRSPDENLGEYADMLPSERNSLWHTMRTAHALFEGDFDKAVQILREASAEYPNLLFVSLALQLKSQEDKSISKPRLNFDDTTASNTDPYLRAISSIIATDNWEYIADQESLPLRERTFVALRYFDDAKLTQWLDKELKKAIETGDIEGIVLTGITDKLVDIFAKYIEKFNDVQTATLVLSICSPKYINDYRCRAWRNAYRAYLQRHKAFMQRTKFEVESTKKSKRGGIPTITPPSRQIALRCVYCDAEYELSKMGGAALPSTGKAQQTAVNPLTATNINAGVSCPNCGRHLPRCVVCLEVVGVPRSDKPEASPDPQIRVAARFPTFCLKCEHVLHLDHARQWFARHVECPVPECRCRCNFRANPELNYR